MSLTILPDGGPTHSHRPDRPRGRPTRAAVAGLSVVVAAAAAGGTWYAVRGGGGATARTVARPSARPSARPATTADIAPAALVRDAMAAARSRQSVHIDVTLTNAGRRVTFNDDAGRSSGEQRITIGGHHATVRVVGSTTFFFADDAALRDFFGLGASRVARYHGRWVRLLHGQENYAVVTEGVTLASAMKAMPVAAPLVQLPARTIGGVRVLGVRGRITTPGAPADATATLWVTAAAPHLPVEFDAVGAAISETTQFSRWNERVLVAAPTHWVTPPAASRAPALTPADAAVRSDLRNVAVDEETYLTDHGVYATAAQVRSTSPVHLSAGDQVTVHLKTSVGYCLAGHHANGRWWIYSSLQGGLQPAATRDSCSTATFPTPGGTLN